MKHYIVTGAAGFIGSHIADALQTAGHKVTGIDDYSTGKHTNTNLRCATSQPDGETEAVIHCAAWPRIGPSFKSTAKTLKNNIVSTINWLDYCRENGARFIYAGSSTCNGDVFANPYALSKHMGEEACRLYSWHCDVHCAIARFYNVYGPRQVEAGPMATAMGVWEKAHKAGLPLPMTGNGKKSRDFTHVEDVVSAILLIDLWMQEKNRRTPTLFHVGTGKTTPIWKILEMFGGEIEKLPERPGEAQETLANNANLRAIGWTPKWNIADYIKQFKERVKSEQS